MKDIEEAREEIKIAGEAGHWGSGEDMVFDWGQAVGYLACYETDPHVRALIEAVKHYRSCYARQMNNDCLGCDESDAALRPFEKEEKILNPSPEAGKL